MKICVRFKLPLSLVEVFIEEFIDELRENLSLKTGKQFSIFLLEEVGCLGELESFCPEDRIRAEVPSLDFRGLIVIVFFLPVLPPIGRNLIILKRGEAFGPFMIIYSYEKKNFIREEG